jgi:hypothetical protein
LAEAILAVVFLLVSVGSVVRNDCVVLPLWLVLSCGWCTSNDRRNFKV